MLVYFACFVAACSRGWSVCVFACLRAGLLRAFACLRAGVFACLRACMHVLCLRTSYDLCLACLSLTYLRFCLIIYFVCINQGFAIKRKLLLHEIWANWCHYKKGYSSWKATNLMKKFLETYLIPNSPKWSDNKLWVSLKTVKLTRLSCEMDKNCYEKWNICTNAKYCKVMGTYFGPFRSYLSNEYNGCS